MKIFYLPLLVTAFQLSAQTDLDMANTYFDDFNYKKAIPHYERALETSASSQPAILEKLADSYYYAGDLQGGKVWYRKLFDLQGTAMEEKYALRLLQSYKAHGEETKAWQLLEEFYRESPGRLKKLQMQSRSLDSLKYRNSSFKVFHMPFNSPESDFAPMYFEDGLVFASSRFPVKNEQKRYAWNNQPYLSLYKVNKDPETEFLTGVRPFNPNLNSDYHEASSALSPNARRIYFAQNYVGGKKLKTNKEGISNMRILTARLDGDQLTNIKSLAINNKAYSCAHPSVSPDGKFLYFASNMPGGYGGSDIYKAPILQDGEVGKAINLGPDINGPGTEMFPFAVAEALYFASDSHVGFGGLDIFVADKGDDGTYSAPLNLGTPINSVKDDFSLITDPEGKTGYFASNRAHGFGDDDIYFFRKESDEYSWYSGQVFDKQDRNPIAHVTLKIYRKGGELVKETLTDIEGRFTVPLSPLFEHTLNFGKSGYNEVNIAVAHTGVPGKSIHNNSIYLLSLKQFSRDEDGVRKIKVNPIYFESWKYDIGLQAKKELDKIVWVLGEFPKLKIKIESHTDARGSDRTNLKLSNQRARATYKYLITKGVDPGRIVSARGYGESRLLNFCTNGVKCSEEEHSLNRRSDFIIVEE